MYPTISIFTPAAQFILITIPCLAIMALIPWVLRNIGLCALKKHFDNANPRLYLASLENEALMNNLQAKYVLRCHACHLNAIENLICWWPAALSALLFSYQDNLALIITAIHFCLRFIYILLYCFTDNQAFSYVRSMVWFSAWACPLIILFECAHNIGKNAWKI